MEKPREHLFGKTREELDNIVAGYGWPAYTSRQIFQWLYGHYADHPAQMSNLPAKVRRILSEHFEMGCSPPSSVSVSADGTKKYLFAGRRGGFIESAYIPEGKRHTLCLSTQFGCRMGCVFCMTGRQGFQGNLDCGELLNQVRGLPERGLLTNIVYMGMGEPLDNTAAVTDSLNILCSADGPGMSPRRITVSTIGIVATLREFMEKTQCRLAISLHSPFEEERSRLVPASKANPLSELIPLIRNFPVEKHRRISFEYIVFGGLNHSPGHARAMARLLNGIRCRINLIAFHAIAGSPLKPPATPDMEAFRAALEAKGLPTTIRRSRGEDIQAACGLLSTLAGREAG